MESITQHKLAHKLTDAITTFLEESEYVQIEDPSTESFLSLRVVLAVEAVCRESIQFHAEHLNLGGSSCHEPFVSSLSFRLFLLVSTEASALSDPVQLIPELKQVITTTLLRHPPC